MPENIQTTQLADTSAHSRFPIPIRAILSLLIMAACIYLFFLPLPELRASDEAMYANIARDMLVNGHFLTPHFQGQPISCFPLYSWLIAFFLSLHLPTVIAVRLPATLALFGIALESGLMARRHKGTTAGFIAATIVLTCFASMRCGIIAQRETLNAFLLTSAWFAWYQLGPQMQQWKIAWGVALGLVALDMTNVGLRAPLIFYLPMLLTRMPPKTRRRLQRPRHLTWLVIFTLGFYLWIQLGCNHPLLPWDSAISGTTETISTGFLRHIFAFPIKCVLYLMPWGMFIWVPFCLALEPLEPKGSSCGFFRAVVFCPALFCWLMPSQSPLMLFCALGPLAFLISMNAELVIHRYDRFFIKVIRWLCGFAALFSTIGALFWFAVYNGNIAITPIFDAPMGTDFRLKALLLGLLLLGCAAIMLYEIFHSSPMYLRIAWGGCAMRFVYLAIVLPVAYLTIPDRKLVAEKLTKDVKKEISSGKISCIYSNTANAHPVQSYYLGVPVHHVTTPLEELPQNDDVVFLLSPYHPSGMNRLWEPVSPTSPAQPVDINALRQYQFTPLAQVMKNHHLTITRIPNPDPGHPRYRPPEECRIYRGTLMK